MTTQDQPFECLLHICFTGLVCFYENFVTMKTKSLMFDFVNKIHTRFSSNVEYNIFIPLRTLPTLISTSNQEAILII